MQVKVEAMKNLKVEKPDGKRDHWRKHNKAKTMRLKQARLQKRFAQG